MSIIRTGENMYDLTDVEDNKIREGRKLFPSTLLVLEKLDKVPLINDGQSRTLADWTQAYSLRFMGPVAMNPTARMNETTFRALLESTDFQLLAG